MYSKKMNRNTRSPVKLYEPKSLLSNEKESTGISSSNIFLTMKPFFVRNQHKLN